LTDKQNLAFWMFKNKFWWLSWNSVSTASYPWCDSLDVLIWNYIISSCNIWTNISWTWTSSYWNYFEWWNNAWTPSWSITPNTILANATWYWPWNYYNNTIFIWWGGLPFPYDWTNPQNNNLWWNTTDSPFWTNISARQWPCANWYHVPSQIEWSGLVTAGWWWTNGMNMINSLKLPIAGYRDRVDGNMWDQNPTTGFGSYWSSSPNGTSWYDLRFGVSVINPSASGHRADALPIRCFKN
jgi:hypothetical protein